MQTILQSESQFPSLSTFQQTRANGLPGRRGTPENSAGSRMTYSRLIGALFLSAIVCYGVGNGLVTSVVGSPDFLATISANRITLALGAFLMLLNSVVVVGLGILFYPIVQNYGRRTALTYFASRIVEAVLLAAGVLCLLMIVPLGQSATAAGEASAAWAEAVGSVLRHANGMSYQIAMLSLGMGGVFVCSLLFRTALVPRWLAGWGVIGYAVFLAGSAAEIFGIEVGLMLSIPGGLFEVALAFWLLVKGFNADAYSHN